MHTWFGRRSKRMPVLQGVVLPSRDDHTSRSDTRADPICAGRAVASGPVNYAGRLGVSALCGYIRVRVRECAHVRELAGGHWKAMTKPGRDLARRNGRAAGEDVPRRTAPGWAARSVGKLQRAGRVRVCMCGFCRNNAALRTRSGGVLAASVWRSGRVRAGGVSVPMRLLRRLWPAAGHSHSPADVRGFRCGAVRAADVGGALSGSILRMAGAMAFTACSLVCAEVGESECQGWFATHIGCTIPRALARNGWVIDARHGVGRRRSGGDLSSSGGPRVLVPCHRLARRFHIYTLCLLQP